MEQIPSVQQRSSPGKLDTLILGGEAAKKRITKGILNYAGVIVSVFVVFVVIVVMTTDIHLMTFADWKELGISFFVLLFASCIVNVSMSSTGKTSGTESSIFISCKKRFDELKEKFVASKWLPRLSDFCEYYVERELKAFRVNILEPEGITYEEYCEKYIGKDEDSLSVQPRNGENDAEGPKKLSQRQIDAIVTANSAKPIKLTSDMLFKRGRGSKTRNPLGQSPESKQFWHYIFKFLQITSTSLLMGFIAFEVIADPDWSTFASVALKVMTVVAHGVSGYISGFENIVVDTVNYMNDQIDLLEQAAQYMEQNPREETCS